MNRNLNYGNLQGKKHLSPNWNHWETPEDHPLKVLLRKRYELACQVVSGLVVDAACGYGVGSAMLAGPADVVVGLDMDREAINEAMSRLPGQCFAVKDLSKEDLPGCDWLVTLETIEHLCEPKRFIHRAKMSAMGIVLSTPIIPTNNPHHFWTHIMPDTVDSWFEGWSKVMDERLPEIVNGKEVDRYLVAAYKR